MTAEAAPRRAWVEQVMGMPVSIHLRGQLGSADAEGRVEAAYDELRAVDVLFSPYREDSQVCRIDRGELAVRDAHPLVAEVVELARTARVLTGGSFDAWRPGGDGLTHFDPTGLVKGWAVQRAAEHLAAGLGCDVSVTAGGDIALRPGRTPAPWRIGIEDPRDPARVLAVVPVAVGRCRDLGHRPPRAAPRRPRDRPAAGDDAAVGHGRRPVADLGRRPRHRGLRPRRRRVSTSSSRWSATRRLVVGRDGYRTTSGLTPQTPDDRHVGVAVAERHAHGRHLVDPAQVVRGQLDVGGAEVLLQVGDPLGARDRHDVVALGEHPGERQLAGGDALLGGELA